MSDFTDPNSDRGRDQSDERRRPEERPRSRHGNRRRDMSRQPQSRSRRGSEDPGSGERGSEERTHRRRSGVGAARSGGADARRPPQTTAKRSPGDANIEPTVDDDVTGTELDEEVRSELSSLRSGDADFVARHLVMAGRLIDEEPDRAYEHAAVARARAPRLAVVREALGLCAYTLSRYQEALAELRAARRISGSPVHLPVMADCERGLGRPEKALDIANDPDARSLDVAARVELLIVAAGARRDLGQLDVALVTLNVPELRSREREPWVARLRYAYADALVAGGRIEEALRWFIRAAEADRFEQTDAAERARELASRGTPG